MKPACGAATIPIAASRWCGLIKNTKPKCRTPSGRKREPDSVSFNTDLFNWYKQLIGLRRQHAVLSRGNLNFFYLNNEERVIGYSRTSDNETILVMVNNSGERKTITTALPTGNDTKRVFVNLIDGKKIKGSNGSYTIELEPYRLLILQ